MIPFVLFGLCFVSATPVGLSYWGEVCDSTERMTLNWSLFPDDAVNALHFSFVLLEILVNTPGVFTLRFAVIDVIVIAGRTTHAANLFRRAIEAPDIPGILFVELAERLIHMCLAESLVHMAQAVAHHVRAAREDITI